MRSDLLLCKILRANSECWIPASETDKLLAGWKFVLLLVLCLPLATKPALVHAHCSSGLGYPCVLNVHWDTAAQLQRILKLKVLSFSSLSRARISAIPWTAAHQASLSITVSQSLLKLMSTESVMPSSDLLLSCPLLLLPLIFPSIGIFSNESALRIRWPKYWSFS